MQSTIKKLTAEYSINIQKNLGSTRTAGAPDAQNSSYSQPVKHPSQQGCYGNSSI